MSVTASWLVLCVILLRFLLQKAPKSFRVILWALVGIRLILPISFESIYSFIPSTEIFTIKNLYDAERMQRITNTVSVLWIIGIAAMLLYALVSYLRIYRRVREAVCRKENVWFCDHIDAPFILGIFIPKIYLPSDMEKQDRKNVVAHERAHLKRKDHWWKPIGFLLLSIHWFNPLLWVAYILLCKDIELACDEKVLTDKGMGIKKEYSESIIHCSVPRNIIAVCPLAFGELDVESRVKSVLDYKKTSFWIMSAATVAFLVLAMGFMTNPVGEGWQSYHPFKNERIVGNLENESYNIENMEIIFGTNAVNQEIIKENIAKAANISEAEVNALISNDEYSTEQMILWGGKEVYELQTTNLTSEKSYFFYPYGYYVASQVDYSYRYDWAGTIRIAEHTLVKSKEDATSEIIYGENCFHLRKPTITVAVGNYTVIDMDYPRAKEYAAMKLKYGDCVTTDDDGIWVKTRGKKIHIVNRKSVDDIMALFMKDEESKKEEWNMGGGRINVLEKSLDSIFIMDAYKDKKDRMHEFRLDYSVCRIAETDKTEMVAGGFLFGYEVYSDLLESFDSKSFPCLFQYSDTEFHIVESEY